MVASVTAFLGVFHIIASGEDSQVVLFGDHICNEVDIRGKRTADPDACNIVHIADHVLYAGIITVTFQFLHNAFRSFDPGFHMLDRIIFMTVLKFIV